MKNIFSLFLTTFTLGLSYAQAEFLPFIEYNNLSSINYMGRDGSDMININDIKGTLYLNEEILEGYIIDATLKNKSKTYLRYDVYNDIFEIQLDSNDEVSKTLNRTPRFQYFLDGEKFVLVETDILKEAHYTSGNGYVVELTSPTASAVLYKRYYKEFNPGSKATTSYQPDISPSIKSNIVYLLKIDGKYTKPEINKKKILDVFPVGKQGAIKKFIKIKDFKFRGTDKEIENEMIQVVRYYNSL